jgi:ribosomal protein L32
MPDQHGKLTDEEAKKATAWLNAHTKLHGCPSCGSNRWTLAPHLVNLMTYAGRAIVIGGPTYPAILLVCNECGHFRLHSAIVAGVLPRPELPKKQQEENAEEANSGA